MAYECQNFKDGQVLTAECLNKMEKGIEEACKDFDDAKGIIVQELIAELQGLPIFGVVDENNTVTVTSLLANGTYALKYENADGSTTKIGSIIVGDGTGDGSGAEVTVYEVDLAGKYVDGKRWSISTGDYSSSSASGFTAIGLIEFERHSGETMTIELDGITWKYDSNTAILMFEDGVFDSANGAMYLNGSHDFDDIGVKAIDNGDGTMTIIITDGTLGKKYNGFKLNGYGSGANAKISYTIV